MQLYYILLEKTFSEHFYFCGKGLYIYTELNDNSLITFSIEVT